jgi:opacity protein-like surface antigen
MKKLILASSLALLAISAQAQTAGYYGGAEVFNNRFSGGLGSTTGAGLFAGYRLGNGLAFEVNGNRIGTVDTGIIKASVSQMSVSAVYSMPVSNTVSVFGRLGYGGMRVSDANSARDRGVKLDNGMVYGGGISYQVNKQVAVRGEFRKPEKDIRGFGVGVSYNF